MEMRFLEECCEILDFMRVPITATDRERGEYPYYGANGIQDYISNYIFDDELVLLAEDGGSFGSKDRPIAYRVSGKCWVNNHAHVLKPKKGLNVDYLCYSLMFYKVDGIINGATRQKLTQAAMRKMLIPLRSMQEQTQVVDILNCIRDIKNKRKQQLQEMDKLVKAQFVEMFGDPSTNSKGFPLVTLPDLGENLDSRRVPITGGDRIAGKYPYYGASGIVDYVADYIFDDDLLLISEDGANLLARATPIAFPSSGKVWINNHAHVIKFRDLAMQCYVEKMINMMDISPYVTGTAQPKLNQAKLNSILIPVPNEDAIKEYLDFVKQVDKSKLLLNTI